MYRKPAFWIVFALVFVGSAIFAYTYFSEAYPLVTLDLQMDRQAALDNAQVLAREHNWGTEGFKQAASFGVDAQVQNFVELEAGGVEAFRRMLTEGLYSPYTWSVRQFKEGETHEVLIRFTPDGKAYGFAEKLPEDEPGASLTSLAARLIAEEAAQEQWQIDLTAYELAEESQEVRPSGRIDHTFVYERPDVQIGEGRYRLRLVVGGDRLSAITHFVKVPEAFSRRYEEMRSANTTISVTAAVAAAVLYILGGCVIGLFFLLRQRWVLWRKAVFWGVFVALLQVLANINRWPLAWMDYDTALSAQGFLLQQVAELVLVFVGFSILLTLTFMAAESLTRKAFPHHIQMWRLWSSDVASSPAVLGRTVSGYLLVGLFFAFDIGLYLFAARVLGWWTPSGALFEPDVLATYFPWLSSIALSLEAGFMEECMFRAIPIAGAALIGQRFGHRRAWIIAAFIIQALIFGGGHAGYPQQPAYARVVELIIPSLGFGLIYLYFGLLPAIVLHFAVDVVWFAMPLFVSEAPGVWVDQALVVLLTLVPLWVVLRSGWRRKKWQELGDEHFNRSWQPPMKAEPEPAVTVVEKTPEIGSQTSRWLLIGGIVGLVIWFLASNFQNHAPLLNVGRNDATELARGTLTDHSVELPDTWQTLGCVSTPLNVQHRYVWQTGGEENYRALMGTYLSPPLWRVRFARFEGDVAERVEEYQVFVAGENKVERFRHKLPEARAGDRLTEEEAREIAHTVLVEGYQLDPADVKEVSAVSSKHPQRRDWLFQFADTLNYPLAEGEARVAVEIAGSQVVDSYRYIHVPEDWVRQERNQRNPAYVTRIICGIVLFLISVAGVIGAVIGWSRGNFSVRVFLGLFVLLFGLGMIEYANGWPCTLAQFSTAEPFANQVFVAVVAALVMLLFVSVIVAVIAGFVHRWRREQAHLAGSRPVWLGFSLGALVAGLLAVISAVFEPSLEPSWADYGALGNYIPMLAAAIDPLAGVVPLGYIMQTTLFLLLFTAVDRFTHGWTRMTALFSLLVVLSALFVTGISAESLISWLLYGLLAGIILLLTYRFVFRFDLALVPLAFGSMAMLGALRQGILNAHPAAIPGAVISIVLIGLLSVYWHRKLTSRT